MKLDKEVKEKEDKWKKESELTRSLMDMRMKKFKEGDKTLDKEIEKVKKELSGLQDPSPQVFAEVTRNTVAEVIEAWTGIKVGNMTKDEMTTMLQLEDELRKTSAGTGSRH